MRIFTTWFIVLPLILLAGCPEAELTTDVDASPDTTVDTAVDATADVTLDATTDTADTATDAGADGDSADNDTLAACDPPNGLRPSRRSEHGGIFDPVGHRVLLYGGSFGVPVNCGFPTPTFEEEVWSYDVRCDQWTTIDATNGPGGRVRHMMAYDSIRHRMIVFGGRYRATASGAYNLYNDLWALDLTSETWSNVPLNAATIPSARVNGAFVFDPTGDRFLLFGGNASASGAAYDAKGDVWQFDMQTLLWSQVQPAAGPAPSARLFTAALWDDSRQWLVFFGGADNTAFAQTAKYFDELWALDFSKPGPPVWVRLDQTSAQRPDGRFWGGLVHDTTTDRYFSFGGHDDATLGNRNDVWAFSPSAMGWAPVTVGDTFNKPANGFCSFPPDFTNVDESLPERRNAHVVVSDGARAFVSGGKTDCGVVDDLWQADFATLSWEELTTATVGEACLRKGVLNCTDMCL